MKKKPIAFPVTTRSLTEEQRKTLIAELDNKRIDLRAYITTTEHKDIAFKLVKENAKSLIQTMI